LPNVEFLIFSRDDLTADASDAVGEPDERFANK